MKDTKALLALMKALPVPLKEKVKCFIHKDIDKRIGTPMASLSMFIGPCQHIRHSNRLESSTRLLFLLRHDLTCILRPASYIFMITEIHVPAMSIINAYHLIRRLVLAILFPASTAVKSI